MKNKKTIFGTILLLFVISGICNIINVSAFTDTTYIPSYSYVSYPMGYLEHGDQILINEIDSDGGIDVYIMIQWQFDEFQDHGVYYCERMWKDTIYLGGWRIDINTDENYYVVLVNKDLLMGRYVDVDLAVYEYIDDTSPDISQIMALITIGVISGIIVLTILLIIRSRKESREIGIQPQEVIKPKTLFCSNCGAENKDTTSDYCPKCRSKVQIKPK